MESYVRSRYGFSQSYFHLSYRFARLKMAKFIDPILSDVISGSARTAAAMRSSMLMPSAPPVEMFTIALVLCLMRGKNCMNTFGSGVGAPVCGLRAWRWIIAAPASAASIDCLAISSGVIGNASDIVGVWIDPVTAQEMITLVRLATAIQSFQISRGP